MVHVVLLKITAMFLVIVAGWLARRRGFLAAEVHGHLEPAGGGRRVSRAGVHADAADCGSGGTARRLVQAPLLCGLLIFIAYFAGLLLAPVFSGKAQRNTFIFLTAIPNWIFLPLPIVQALYGDTGVRTVLLCNVGAQLVLWSFGVWILHGAMRQAAKNLYTNMGFGRRRRESSSRCCFPPRVIWKPSTPRTRRWG